MSFIVRNDRFYSHFSGTTEAFVNPETLFSNYGLRGVFAWKSLCEFSLQLPRSKSDLIETFTTASASKAENMKKYIISSVIPTSEKAGDITALFDLLKCDDEQVREQISKAVLSVQLETEVRTQSIQIISKEFDMAIIALKQHDCSEKYAIQILPLALNSLTTLLLLVVSRHGKGASYSELETACLKMTQTVSELLNNEELTMADHVVPLKEMLLCFGSRKVVRNRNLIDEATKVTRDKKKLYKQIGTLSYLEQYAVVFIILQQIFQRISQDKVDLLREVVSALIRILSKKEKTEKLLFPILILVTKTIVKLLNATNSIQVLSVETQLQLIYLQGILTLMLDSKKINHSRRCKLLEEVQVLLFHKTTPIVHMTVHWFERNDATLIRNMTLTHIEYLLGKLDLRIHRTLSTPLGSPSWATLQGVIGSNRDVDVHCLFPTIDCIKAGIMTDYKNKSDPDETKKRINSLEIMKILQDSNTHKNILTLHAFQCRPMPLFYIVDRPNGSNLLTFLLQTRTEKAWLSPALLCQLVHDAIQAVAHLQSKNIVHRNLIAKSFCIDTSNTLKLTDFSIARCIDSEVVSVSELESKDVATRWCSPETLLEGKFDFKTDVWTLGQLIYEIFTHGCQPFTELYDTPTSKVMELVVFQFLKPKQWPCIPKEIHDIILECVKADPDERAAIKTVHDHLKQYMSSGILTNAKFSVSRMCQVDQMYPELHTKRIVKDQFIERGIPKLFLDLKTMPDDPRCSYARQVSRVVSQNLEVFENELKAPDIPMYKDQASVLEVWEPTTQAFVETVLPLLTGCITNWLHIRQWPIVVHKRTTDELMEYTCNLMYGCERGESLLNIALSHRLGELSTTNIKTEYYEILCQAAQLVGNVHSKHFLLMDICCTNLYYCFNSGKVFMPRLGRICYLNPSHTLGDSVIGKEFRDRKHWMPLEVLQSRQYSTGSDVYMLAMMFLEFFVALELGEEVPFKNRLYAVPFPKVKQEKLLEHLYRGEKPDRPKYCPSWIYEIMVRCWDRDRTQRPSAADVYKKLHARLSGTTEDSESDYNILSINRPKEPKQNPDYDEWILKFPDQKIVPSPNKSNSFPPVSLKKTKTKKISKWASTPANITILPPVDNINTTCDANDAHATCFCNTCSGEIPTIPSRKSSEHQSLTSNLSIHKNRSFSETDMQHNTTDNNRSSTDIPFRHPVARRLDLERVSHYIRIDSWRSQSLPRDSKVSTLYDSIPNSIDPKLRPGSLSIRSGKARQTNILTLYDKIPDNEGTGFNNISRSEQPGSLRNLNKKLPRPDEISQERNILSSITSESDTGDSATYITATPEEEVGKGAPTVT